MHEVVPESTATRLGLSMRATLSPAPQGMTSEVAFVDDRGRKSVLKRCRNPIYIEWLRHEHQVLLALADTALRVPRVCGYHEERRGDQIVDVWLHMTRLPGESLWGLILRAPVDRPHHLRTLGNLLRELHAVKPPQALRHERPWIERMLEQARDNLAWSDGSASLLAQLEAERPAPWPETLIHGDMALDNVLIDDADELSLIDWSGGDAGDPRYDIALALATEPELQLDDRDVAAFFDGYGRPPIDRASLRWFVDLYEFF